MEDELKKQVKKTTIYTALPMAVFMIILVVVILLINLPNTVIFTGSTSPVIIIMLISLCYVVLAFVVSLVLFLRKHRMIARRVFVINTLNLFVFIVVSVLILVNV